MSELESRWNYDPTSRSWSWQAKPFQTSIVPFAPGKAVGEPICVSLEAQSGSSLTWAELDQLPSSSLILWHLNLGLLPMPLPVTEQARFRSLQFSIDEFTQRVWRRFRSRSLGVILHQGSLKLEGFYWDLEQTEQFASWLEERRDPERQQLACQVREQIALGGRVEGCALEHLCTRQYILELLSQYCHYLASSLDEECPALLSFQGEGLSLEEQLQLLGPSLWEHLLLIGEGIHPSLLALRSCSGVIEPMIQPAAELALVLPEGAYLGPVSAMQVAQVMRQLDTHHLDYRLIRQEQLSQEWAGIEQLIVIGSSLSSQAVRWLRGFQAAGGSVLSIGYGEELACLGKPCREIGDLRQWQQGSFDLAALLATR